MKKIFFLTALMLTAVSIFFVFYSSANEPTDDQWGSIMNISGRNRMLSQKMTKETFLIRADVDVELNKENLKETTELFKKSLKGLRDGDSSLNLPPCQNERIIRQLDKVKDLYFVLDPIFQKAIIGKQLNLDELNKLAVENLNVLKNMNKAVKMFERGANKVLGSKGELGVVINLAGKQRMLTQKMTKEMLLVFLDVNKEDNIIAIRSTSALFDKTLKGLKDGDEDLGLPGTTDESIRAQLDIVTDLWNEFYPIIKKSSDAETESISREDLEKVAKDNIPLLKNMNKAVGMYEMLSK